MVKRSNKGSQGKRARAPEGRKRGSGRADPEEAADREDADPQDADPQDADPQDADPQDADPQDADPQDADPDPLALQPWSTRTCPTAEAGERARFERAWEAFRRGDFRVCRELAAALAAEAESSEVRQRAQTLEARLRVDPFALGMAAVALSLLLTAVIWTFG